MRTFRLHRTFDHPPPNRAASPSSLLHSAASRSCNRHLSSALAPPFVIAAAIPDSSEPEPRRSSSRATSIALAAGIDSADPLLHRPTAALRFLHLLQLRPPPSSVDLVPIGEYV
ncbi:hypothetical protein BRADI_1g54123v3 [Brachypodium distachyon]|uniref:Uncharacterized protein n=1 Tax=Brachypodium distachyon TaxID=15368 RepID=A0A2K2DRD0_BRADI|nr:hypothetical protein BRADI_1g54123v3 [Brachypodium distachyon]